jgi:hypothetical protein
MPNTESKTIAAAAEEEVNTDGYRNWSWALICTVIATIVSP